MKRKLLTVIFIFLLPIGFALQPGFAQEPEPEAETPTQDMEEVVVVNCAADIIGPTKAKSREFADFLTVHFRSEKPTSLLTAQAFDRYRYYVREIRNIIYDYYPEREQLQAPEVSQKAACRAFLEDELVIAREVMGKHLLQNARAKKTTLLLDHYKDLNRQMDSLQFSTAQLYGYIEGFSNRLPCYVDTCTTR